jgi:hypothetical protein
MDVDGSRDTRSFYDGLAATYDRIFPDWAASSLPHLLTAADVGAALREMRRVTRTGGLVAVSTRDYDALREQRPRATPVQISGYGQDEVVTLQVWHWDADGERYDLDHLQLSRRGRPEDGWRLTSRRARYWAIPRGRLAGLAREAGLGDVRWRMPEEEGGFYQPLMLATAAR